MFSTQNGNAIVFVSPSTRNVNLMSVNMCIMEDIKQQNY
jgi:hypothetical protein